MAKLVVEAGALAGKTFVILMRRPFLIGRGHRAQIDIPDPLASRRHCQIEIKGDLFFARDLDSANGTLVNGKRVSFAALLDGDRLQVGSTVFRFSGDSGGDPRIGREFGGYRVTALVGRGGMGTVYRADQVSLGRQVALKVLSEDLARDPEFVDLFLREARAAAALTHPHIVKVFEVGSAAGLHFFSMEFVPGGTVEERLATSGRLSVDDALRIAKEAASGLVYAASRNLVHRDIKPGNLLLDLVFRLEDLGAGVNEVRTRQGHEPLRADQTAHVNKSAKVDFVPSPAQKRRIEALFGKDFDIYEGIAARR